MRRIAITASEVERLYVAGFLSDLFHFDATILTPNLRLDEDLGLDSLSVIEAVMEFEARFDIEVPDTVTFKLVTVGDLMDLYLHRRDFIFT